MSGQLLTTPPEQAEPDVQPSALRRVASVLVLGVVLGALGGVAWELLWTPPTGAAYQGRWMPDGLGAPRLVDATAWFVIVGAVYGLLYGTVVARVLRGREVLTMLTLLVGALLAAWVTQQVGQWLGPPDAAALARDMDDLEALVSNLELSPSSASWWPGFLGSPARLIPAFAALIALAVVNLGTREPEARPRRRVR